MDVGVDVGVGVGVGVDVAAITVKLTAGLITPDRVAEILVVPAAIPVAKPSLGVMVAMAVLELAQLTCEVISAVDPSEYVPVAVNCWVEPIAKLAGVASSVIAMEDNVAGVAALNIDRSGHHSMWIISCNCVLTILCCDQSCRVIRVPASKPKATAVPVLGVIVIEVLDIAVIVPLTIVGSSTNNT